MERLTSHCFVPFAAPKNSLPQTAVVHETRISPGCAGFFLSGAIRRLDDHPTRDSASGLSLWACACLSQALAISGASLCFWMRWLGVSENASMAM